jgi:hypothetical protein
MKSIVIVGLIVSAAFAHADEAKVAPHAINFNFCSSRQPAIPKSMEGKWTFLVADGYHSEEVAGYPDYGIPGEYRETLLIDGEGNVTLSPQSYADSRVKKAPCVFLQLEKIGSSGEQLSIVWPYWNLNGFEPSKLVVRLRLNEETGKTASQLHLLVHQPILPLTISYGSAAETFEPLKK